MRESPPKVITIPAKPEVARRQAIQRQLRVAAYCRVSTDDEEQLTSYEAQQNYYTDKIMTNREWTMAGIFADEGITGTSARKRPEFLKMIRLCKQKKIDIVLTKSISRFARNTVDCLNYIRALRELGIAVIFEKRTSTRWKPTARSSSPCLEPSLRQKARASAPMSAGASGRPCARERQSYSITGCTPMKKARTASRKSSRSKQMWFVRSMTSI